MNFYDKYIKYKLKYIKFKKNIEQIGGVNILLSNNDPTIDITINNAGYDCEKLINFLKLNNLNIPIIECNKSPYSSKKFTIKFRNRDIANEWLDYIKQNLTEKNLESYIKSKGKLPDKRLKQILPVDITNPNANLISTTEEEVDTRPQPNEVSVDVSNSNANLINTTEEEVDTRPQPNEVPVDVSRSNGNFTDTELSDILNSNGQGNNFLTNSPNSQKYTDNIPKWKNLPLYDTDKVKEFIDLLAKNQVILLTSGTGSGKTVLVPKLVLAYNMKNNRTGKIGITNPKKITTESNAKYAAETLDVKLGDLVGYRHKDKSETDKTNTKLIYQTDGILLASSIHTVIDYDTIIIDEAHERNVSIDFLLLLLKNHVLTHPEFKLIIMSATINADVFTRYFNVAGIKFGSIHISSAPNFPIVHHYEPKIISENKRKNRIQLIMPQLCTLLSESTSGDILIFVATVDETKQGCKELEKICKDVNKLKEYKITTDICNSLFCIGLSAHSDANTKELAVNKDKYKTNTKYTRKVIFATNVAESSLTIDGLKYVIDIGDELKTSYEHIQNMDKITISKTSKAQVKQRIGRVGRISEGIAYHVYTENEYNAFSEYPLTKIESDDIISNILDLIDAEKSITGMIDNVQKLITVPAVSKIVNCIYRLYLLESIELDSIPTNWSNFTNYEQLKSITGKISKMGKTILNFRSVPLECAYAMIYAKYNNCLDEIIIIMAMLQEKLNKLFDDSNKDNLYTFVSGSIDTSSEHITLLNIYRNFHKNKNYGTFLNESTFKDVDATINDYTRMCRQVNTNDEKFKVKSFNKHSIDARIKLVLAFAYKLNLLLIKDDISSLLFLYRVKYQIIDNLFATNITDETKFVVCHSYSSIMGNESFKTATKISNEIIKLLLGDI
jgi:HrpA-like RNA helicase